MGLGAAAGAGRREVVVGGCALVGRDVAGFRSVVLVVAGVDGVCRGDVVVGLTDGVVVGTPGVVVLGTAGVVVGTTAVVVGTTVVVVGTTVDGVVVTTGVVVIGTMVVVVIVSVGVMLAGRVVLLEGVTVTGTVVVVAGSRLGLTTTCAVWPESVGGSICTEIPRLALTLALKDGPDDAVVVSVVVVVGSLVVVTVDWLVGVSVLGESASPGVSATLVSSGTVPSSGVSEMLATSLIAPTSVAVSDPFDVSVTSDDASTLLARSVRFESVASTDPPMTRAISAATAPARGRCRGRSPTVSRGDFW